MEGNAIKEYREMIRKDINEMKEELELVKSSYRRKIDSYIGNFAELNMDILKDKIDKENYLLLERKLLDYFKNFSEKKADQVVNAFKKIFQLTSTADTPEKMEVLYKELEEAWKKIGEESE
ncbi:MAG: hypothetical protein ACE5J7_00415 [Candidatus Aenigmatarchaeota archaeon]